MIERKISYVAALSFLALMTFVIAIILLSLFGTEDVGFISIVIAFVITAGVHSVNSNLLRSVSSFDRLIHSNLRSIPVNAFVEVIRPFCNQKNENDDSSVTEYFTGSDDTNIFICGFRTYKNKINYLHPLAPRNFTVLFVKTIKIDDEKITSGETATFDCRFYLCTDISYQLSCGTQPHTQFVDENMEKLWEEVSNSLEPILVDDKDNLFSELNPATLHEVCQFYELITQIPYIAITQPDQT